MEIRKKSLLAEQYGSADRVILATSPELVFMNALCAGDIDAALALFAEEKLFGKTPVVVDAPQGRYVGKEAIRQFAAGWLPLFRADYARVVPVVQTRANGRSVLELEVHFVVDGAIEQVPMLIVGDLRTPSLLDELRIYFHFTHVPALTGYRQPMFSSTYLEMGEPALLTGAVREYYEAIHHIPAIDVDRAMDAMAEGCKFGGYDPVGKEVHLNVSRPELRAKYEKMAGYIPRRVGMRYETIIDDNTTCVIEWVHIVSDAGREEAGRVCLSGVAAYERGPDGRLCAIRISDYAGFEQEIDWTKTPISKEEAFAINAVEEFPPHASYAKK